MADKLRCENCGSERCVAIIYGMPSHDLFLEAEEGKVKLGGCCVTGSDPAYFCKDCEHKWG